MNKIEQNGTKRIKAGQNVLVCFGVFWYVLVHFGMFCYVLVRYLESDRKTLIFCGIAIKIVGYNLHLLEPHALHNNQIN